MTVANLITALNGTAYKFAHFAWSKAPSTTYGTVSETDFEAVWADDKKAEEKVKCDVDVYTRDDTDTMKSTVEAVFDNLGCAYSIAMIDYESETGFIHYCWEVENTYG